MRCIIGIKNKEENKMDSLILGIIIGGLLAIVIAIIGYFVYEGFMWDSKARIPCIVVTVFLCLATVFSITLGMCSHSKLKSSAYIEKYKTVKTTIEESIHSTSISGAERLQLVQTAVNENSNLAETQFDCKQWYGFLIDKDVLKLEPIDLD